MAEAQSRIPPSYQDSVLRCVLPVCFATGRVALAFDTADGQILRIALTQEHAAWLADRLSKYMSEAAGAHVPGAAPLLGRVAEPDRLPASSQQFDWFTIWRREEGSLQELLLRSSPGVRPKGPETQREASPKAPLARFVSQFPRMAKAMLRCARFLEAAAGEGAARHPAEQRPSAPL